MDPREDAVNARNFETTLVADSSGLSQTPVSMTLMEILHDPRIFKDPLTFNPGRWLEQNPEAEGLDRYMVGFGKGSRMCLGMK